MKLVYALLLIICTGTTYGQENKVKKPEYIIIINDEIVTKDKMMEYANAGNVSGMRKGVNAEEFERLKKKFGDKVGDDAMFIMAISVYTEAEKKLKASNAANKKVAAPLPDTSKADAGFILKANDRAKDFTVDMLDGSKIRLADLKGKVVLVNFWATWCAPCIMEFYDIPSHIHEPFSSKGLVFVAIARGEGKEKVAAKMAQLKTKGISFNVGFDPNEKIWNEYGRNSIPKSYLIDQNGVIRYVSEGYNETKMAQMVAEIKKLLKS